MVDNVCNFTLLLLQASSLLVGAIKGDAEGLGEGDSQQKLLGAARQLADATARMIEAAKVRLFVYVVG